MPVPTLVLLAALAGPPAVPFEGRARYDFRSADAGSGQATVTVGKEGVRSELRLHSAELDRAGRRDGLILVRLQRRGDARRVWLVDERARAYAAVPASAGGEAVRVEKRGRSNAGGRACARVVVTAASGARDDLCVTHELGALPSIAAFAARRPAAQAEAALAAAGLDGLPVRWVAFAPDGAVAFELDLRSARRERVGAEPFRLPASGRERPAAELPGAALDAGIRPPQTREERARLQRLLDDVARRE